MSVSKCISSCGLLSLSYKSSIYSFRLSYTFNTLPSLSRKCGLCFFFLLVNCDTFLFNHRSIFPCISCFSNSSHYLSHRFSLAVSLQVSCIFDLSHGMCFLHSLLVKLCSKWRKLINDTEVITDQTMSIRVFFDCNW